MPLILAIDPDKRQSTQLATLVKTQLQAELVHRATAAEALDALKGRVPDLVLTSTLISPREDAALAAHLRHLGAAATHVQTITIPLLGSAAPQRAKSVLAALRREKPQAAMTDGCAPDVFAEQIRQYLRTADEQKAAAAAPFDAALAEEPVAETAFEPAVAGEEIAIEAAPPPEPEAALGDEPERLPLSQLLRLVSDWTTAPTAPAEAPPPASELDDLSIDPVAAQALEELSRRLPEASLADGIPAEAPVPVVEMQTFETLDAIASQLAAAPPSKHESLDDLASLFAATPTRPHAAPLACGFDTQSAARGHEFDSLFAEPSASTESAAPIEVPGIDPSLFASPAAQPPSADPPSFESRIVPAADRDAVAAAESFLHEPVPVESAAEPMPAEPWSAEPIPAEPPPAEPVLVEPVVEDVLAETALPEFELLEPASTEWEQEAAVTRSWAQATEPSDEEIALDVDAFDAAAATPVPAAEPAAPADTAFSFTFVDGFGDTWSDFEVPSVAAVAADFGLPPRAPMETEPAAPAAAADPAPTAAPVLDDDALSLIGDAAHKASLDLFVIEELERGVRRAARKAKNTHAGATHVAPAATPAVKKKAPVQDEWGLFDPEQCGFAALEEEDPAERRKARDGTRVRVISY